jgi:hypothetical protein
MGFVELILGWFIVTALGIGSIVAVEPFWGRGSGRAEIVVLDTARDAVDASRGAPETRRAA